MSAAVVLVAALDRRLAIGKGNALPWHLPDDLKRFKALTLGETILMGRRTAESIGRALPRRTNLVLTRSGYVHLDGMQPVVSLDAALEIAGGELVVIGGGEVYAMTLPIATTLHLTHVDTVVEDADAHFPAFDPAAWTVMHREAHAADERHAFAFEFVDYQRA